MYCRLVVALVTFRGEKEGAGAGGPGGWGGSAKDRQHKIQTRRRHKVLISLGRTRGGLRKSYISVRPGGRFLRKRLHYVEPKTTDQKKTLTLPPQSNYTSLFTSVLADNKQKKGAAAKMNRGKGHLTARSRVYPERKGRFIRNDALKMGTKSRTKKKGSEANYAEANNIKASTRSRATFRTSVAEHNNNRVHFQSLNGTEGDRRKRPTGPLKGVRASEVADSQFQRDRPAYIVAGRPG